MLGEQRLPLIPPTDPPSSDAWLPLTSVRPVRREPRVALACRPLPVTTRSASIRYTLSRALFLFFPPRFCAPAAAPINWKPIKT